MKSEKQLAQGKETYHTGSHYHREIMYRKHVMLEEATTGRLRQESMSCRKWLPQEDKARKHAMLEVATTGRYCTESMSFWKRLPQED